MKEPRSRFGTPGAAAISRRPLLKGALATTGALMLGRPATAQQNDGYVQAVGSSHAQATAAGMQALVDGGTAADAMLAVTAVLSVVEPYFSHVLGGGTWGLYYDAESGEVTALDGVGPSGSLATYERYAAVMWTPGIHQANVPGAWDGWMQWLARYGRLGVSDLLAPAIALARDGFRVSAEMGIFLGFEENDVLNHPPTAAIYAPNGSLVDASQTIANPDLAATFEALAAAYDGAGNREAGIQAARDYCYRGPIAEAIVAESERDGGFLTLDDFAGFEAEIVEAVSVPYGSTMRVYQCPPNSQGATMLLALNILKGIDHSGLSPHHPDVIHSQVEALKLAFGDRHAFIGDPDHVDIDLDYLLSDEHAAEQLARIDMDRAMVWPENMELQMSPANTTTIQVTDRWGNAATVTTSIGFQFRVIAGTGININERMRFYSLLHNRPNVVAPRKKVRHTSCPYIVLRDGQPFVIGGNTGVDTQPQAQLQQLMAAIDFSLSAQEAINLKRWISTAFPASIIPADIENTLQLEEGFPESPIAELRSRGHDIVVGTGIVGSGGMIKLSADRLSADVGVDRRMSTSSAETRPAS